MSKRSKKRSKKGQSVQHVNQKPASPSVWKKHTDLIYMVIVLTLLVIYFSPLLTGGKTFQQPDSIASKSMQPFIDEAFANKTYPLWNPYIFGGMPSFASLSRAPYMDIVGDLINGTYSILKLILPISNFTRNLLNALLLGIAMYYLLRIKNIKPSIALYSSLAVVFLPQVIAYSAFGHNTKLNTIIFLPLLFMLIEKLLDKKNILWFCLTSLAIGLMLLRFHVQMCFYTLFMMGLYFLYWTVSQIKGKKQIQTILTGSALLVLAIFLGLCISSVVNLSVWEYADYSIRGGSNAGGLEYDYATGWSFPPSEMLTFINPSFMGFGRETYWGPMTFTDFPLYFGIVTLLLAGCAIVVRRDKTVWFLTILSGLALVISFGKHLPILYYPMFKLLPFFNKFRAPKMIHILLQFSMVVLAGLGLQGILNMVSEKNTALLKHLKRYLLIFGAIVLLLLFLLLVGKSGYLGWASKLRQNADTAYDKALQDGFRALLFFLLSAGAVFLTLKIKIKSHWFPFICIVLMLFDVWPVSKRFANPQPKSDERFFFSETEEIKYLKNQEKPFRIVQILDQRPPNWYAYHKLQNVWGYQGAKLKIYQEFMDALQMPNGPNGFNGLLQNYIKIENGQPVFKKPDEIIPHQLIPSHNFMKLLNTKYILSPYPIPDPSFQPLFPPKRRGSNGIYFYKDALPRIFFPETAIRVKGKEAILDYITSPEFKPEKTAVLEEMPLFEIIPSDSNMVKIIKYDIHEIEITADIKNPALMVLSEIYYPAGWKAYIDNKETKIWKTNYILRSLFIEPGNHNVKFIFKPKAFRTGIIVSTITILLLLSGIVFGVLQEKRRNNNQ